jgi:hypothetical protein
MEREKLEISPETIEKTEVVMRENRDTDLSFSQSEI